MKYLIQFLKKKKGELIVTMLLLMGQVAGTLVIPYLIAGIVDRGILKGDMDMILQIGVQMLAAALITAAVSVLGSFYSADLAAAFGRDMREEIFRKSQDLSIREFDTIGVSSMITRTTSDISSLQQTLVMFLQMIVPAPLIAIVSIIMTARVNPALTLIPVACILLFALMAWIILKKSVPLSKRIQVRMDKINQVVREAISGIRVIRAFDNGVYEQERCNDAFSAYASNMVKLNRLFAALNPTVWLVMGLSMAAIVWFGGFLSVGGIMEIGEITAVTEYTIMTLGYLIMAAMSGVTLPKMRACLSRLEEVLDMEPEIADIGRIKGVGSERAKTADYDGAEIALRQDIPVIEFDHVTFLYHGAEEPVLKDLSFCCRAGQTTAIIGGTGSGKSTIANLLLRLHDVDTGQIRLYGKNIRDYSQQVLREHIGYVPQKAFLFSGTIAENLRMGRKEATEAQMHRALSIAQAETFIESLPMGLEAPVSQGGSNFSGGQKQRLAIARAVIKDAPVLVFDDSFSALDYKTDAALRKTLKQDVKEAAKIIIAQRVSTIVDADQIIVLDEGRVVGIGGHKELLKNCLVYRAIAKSQISIEEVSDDEAI